jgi:hypothetical protein
MKRLASLLTLLCAIVLGVVVAAQPARAPQVDDGARLMAALASHPVFSSTLFLENKKFERLTYVFHRPAPNAVAGFEDAMAAAHGQWLQHVEEMFRFEYAKKLGLTRRADRPSSRVIVMFTQQEYDKYFKTLTEPDYFSNFAHFDLQLGATIFFEYRLPTLEPHLRRQAELAAMARGELYAHAADDSVRLPYFLAEGFSAYLASHEGNDLRAFEKRSVNRAVIDKLVRTLHNPPTRDATLAPLAELFEVTTYAELRAKIAARLKVAPEKLIHPKDGLEHAFGQAWSLVHYMVAGENGKYRAAFEKYLKLALEGNGSFTSFKSAFSDFNIQGLEVSYYKWLVAEFKRLFPGTKIDESVVDYLTSRPAAAPGGAATTSDKSSPELASLSDLDVPSRHAALLYEIRAGHLSKAIEALEALRGSPRVGEWGPKIDREVVRCRKFGALRDKHLAQLAAAGGRYLFERDGKKINAKVKSYSEGKLYLEDNKAKIQYLHADDLDPYEIAKAMDKTLFEGADGWVRWYPFVLFGDAKALKALKGTPEGEALLADAESWYPDALKTGEAVHAIQAVVGAGDPKDKAAAEACYASLQALVAAHGKTELVKSRAGQLKGLATKALELSFEPAKLAEITSAKVESLGKDRVRITYQFDKKEDAADFVADHGYFASWRKNLKDRQVAAAPEGTVANGAFRVRGAACWRSLWTFGDSILIRYELALEELDGDESRSPVFAVAACDDKLENFIWCQGFGSLYANDAKTKYVKSDSLSEGKDIQSGTIYTLDLEIGAGRAVTRDDGSTVKVIDGVPHRTGGVFLFVHSDVPVLFEKIVIEGKPDVVKIKSTWIAKKIADLGL